MEKPFCKYQTEYDTLLAAVATIAYYTGAMNSLLELMVVHGNLLTREIQSLVRRAQALLEEWYGEFPRTH